MRLAGPVYQAGSSKRPRRQTDDKTGRQAGSSKQQTCSRAGRKTALVWHRGKDMLSLARQPAAYLWQISIFILYRVIWEFSLHTFRKTYEHYGQFFGSSRPGTDFQPRERYDWFLGHPTHTEFKQLFHSPFSACSWSGAQIKLREIAPTVSGSYTVEGQLAGFIKIW